MTITLYELPIYGEERSVEIKAKEGSVFITVGDSCLELDRQEFEILVEQEMKGISEAELDLI